MKVSVSFAAFSKCVGIILLWGSLLSNGTGEEIPSVPYLSIQEVLKSSQWLEMKGQFGEVIIRQEIVKGGLTREVNDNGKVRVLPASIPIKVITFFDFKNDRLKQEYIYEPLTNNTVSAGVAALKNRYYFYHYRYKEWIPYSEKKHTKLFSKYQLAESFKYLWTKPYLINQQERLKKIIRHNSFSKRPAHDQIEILQFAESLDYTAALETLMFRIDYFKPVISSGKLSKNGLLSSLKVDRGDGKFLLNISNSIVSKFPQFKTLSKDDYMNLVESHGLPEEIYYSRKKSNIQGFILAGKPNSKVVRYVWERSPASKGGLKVNDKIIDVSSKSMRGEWDVTKMSGSRLMAQIYMTLILGKDPKPVRFSIEIERQKVRRILTLEYSLEEIVLELEARLKELELKNDNSENSIALKKMYRKKLISIRESVK